MFPKLPLDVLPDYIENSLQISMTAKTMTITIYNFIVGSYMGDMQILELNPELKRNHEFPQVVKNILYNPELQFSPEMQEFISHMETITIRQILFLIDPMYETNAVYSGLELEISSELSSEILLLEDERFIKEHKICHNEFKFTAIRSIVEPIIISESIDKRNIFATIEQITRYSLKIPIIINIIDCTSSILSELYVNNTNPYVYISVPNCLLHDDDIQYMPVITYDKELGMRWNNYDLDTSSLEDLKIVKDICKNAEITYKFLTTLYKVQVCNMDLVTIFKFLGLLNITKAYDFGSSGKIVFGNLQFTDFVKLCELPAFIKMFANNFDEYFKYNIIAYITKLVKNPKILSRIEHNNNIREILLLEAIEIFRTLQGYFPEDITDLGDFSERTMKDNIRTYLKKNNVHM